MRPSEQNEKTFSKNVAVFEENYWRPDEEEAVKFLKKGKLLIGGVGAGRTVGPLLEKGFDITAVDISPQMIEMCRKRWSDVPASVMDLQKTTFANETFDSIFLPFHTIAYVDDLDETLREMNRILKPGGTFVFSIPNFWYIRQITHGQIFHGKRHLTHITRKSEDTLSTIFLSMLDTGRLRKIFPYVKARGRVSLQILENPNWKDKVLQRIPFIDKSLYFFCKKG